MSETVSIYKLGIYGKAYDVPGARRAYTYQYQPDNQGAWRIGEAMTMASLTGGGDYIDTGLGLLKQLERKGYGVYELDESKAQGIPEGLFCTCGLRRSANPHPDAGKPGRYLEVGTQHECIPCTVKSRHEWAQRATKAESQLHELAKHGEQQVKVLEAKNQHQLEEINILNGQLDKFRSQSHGIPALAEIERLRAALHSCAKASSAAEVGLIVDDALAASQAQQALAPENQRVVPAEPLLAKPHPFEAMRKRFSDIEDEVARGKHSAMSCFTAMRTAALYTEPSPAPVNRIPAGLYAELEALRTLRDATDVYLQGYMLDEIEDEDNCVTVDQHDAACSVKAALDSSRALEWKGGEYSDLKSEKSLPGLTAGDPRLVHVPALDEHLRYILGRPNFWCYHLANALRAMGQEIARKAEEEQAAVIHFLLNAYFEHGPGWREAVEKILAAEREKELAKGGDK